MSASDTERNLLFGILALQMDLCQPRANCWRPYGVVAGQSRADGSGSRTAADRQKGYSGKTSRSSVTYLLQTSESLMSPITPRQTLLDTLFPHGVPRLWCPLLSHFRSDGSIDVARMERHLTAIAPFVKGIMLPGSTGEGWDMTEVQIRELLTVVLRLARPLDLRVLIGVLRKELSRCWP